MNLYLKSLQINCMTNKTTLSINQDIFNKANLYADRRGIPLTTLVEKYLLKIAMREDQKSTKLNTVSNLMGVVEVPQEEDYNVVIAKALINKFALFYKEYKEL